MNLFRDTFLELSFLTTSSRTNCIDLMDKNINYVIASEWISAPPVPCNECDVNFFNYLTSTINRRLIHQCALRALNINRCSPTDYLERMRATSGQRSGGLRVDALEIAAAIFHVISLGTSSFFPERTRCISECEMNGRGKKCVISFSSSECRVHLAAPRCCSPISRRFPSRSPPTRKWLKMCSHARDYGAAARGKSKICHRVSLIAAAARRTSLGRVDFLLRKEFRALGALGCWWPFLLSAYSVNVVAALFGRGS